MPVDKVARAVIELTSRSSDYPSVVNVNSESAVVYHVQNTQTFHWTRDLLPALRSAGLEFETISQREWIRKLRKGEQDPVKNPTIKLLDFYAEKYDNDKPGRAGLEFAMDQSSKQSVAIREGFDVLQSGLMRKTIIEWGLGPA